MSLPPDLASRLGKLLRLACSTGPDGEKLAAIGRLSATAEAYDIDWDHALNGSEIPREDMQQIFDAGYRQGAADKQQELRPERDWTSITSSPVGEGADRLKKILDGAAESRDAGLLSDWEGTFSGDMQARFERYGRRLFVSERQWQSLDRLEAKLRRQGFID